MALVSRPPRPMSSSLTPAIDCLVYALGACLVAGITYSWVERLDLRWTAGHFALTTAFFIVPLATSAYQLPLDYAYQLDPWRETAATPIRPQNPLLTDVVTQMLPFRALVRERLLRLDAPLWSHELGTGQPLLGNAQSAPFAPLHLLALPLPVPRAMTVTAAWQMFLSLLLMHLLLRELGAAPIGSAFAAIAFGLSAFQVGWLYHPLASVAAFIPGLFLGLLRLARGTPRALAGLVLCATAMVASGNPEVVGKAAAAAAVVWLVLWLRQPDRRAFVRRSVTGTLLIAGFSAPVLLPLLETIPASERAILLREAPAAVQPPPFAARRLVAAVNPLTFGSPRDGNWHHLSNYLEIATGYAGVLTAAIALAGLAVLRDRVAVITSAGLASLLAAFGWPPLQQLLLMIPLFANSPMGRLRLSWTLAAAVAAGLSLERLAGDRSARALTALLLAAGMVAIQASSPVGETGWQLAWRQTATAGLAAAALALALSRGRAFPAVALAGLTLELFVLGVRFHPVVPATMSLDPPPAVAALQAARELAALPFRSIAAGGRLLPYLPAIHGLWDPRGFDPMRPGHALQLLRKRLDRPALGGMFLMRADPDGRMLRFLGVRWLLAGPSEQLPAPWREIHRSQRSVVWENPEAPSIFFFPRRVERTPGREDALAWALAHPDLAAAACVEGPAGPVRHQDGEVVSIKPASNALSVVARSPRGGVLASSVTWMRGWRAEVDGAPTAVLRVDGAFLGAAVGPGRHEVRFLYTPSAWRIGLFAFAAATIAAVGMAVAMSRRERRRDGDGAP